MKNIENYLSMVFNYCIVNCNKPCGLSCSIKIVVKILVIVYRFASHIALKTTFLAESTRRFVAV